MNKKLTLGFVLLVVSSLATLTVPAVFAKPVGVPRDGTHTIYVTSQGKYYDTIVPISSAQGLPWSEHNTGSFQQLDNGVTAYGPGDPGYRGGRWWIDNPVMGTVGEQDVYDTFFLCPLLGPGRDSP